MMPRTETADYGYAPPRRSVPCDRCRRPVQVTARLLAQAREMEIEILCPGCEVEEDEVTF